MKATRLKLSWSVLAISTSVMGLGMAASDTDVYLEKVSKVEIEDEKITIVAEASIIMRTLAGKHDPAYRGPQLFGRPMSLTKVKADEATFTILKPTVAKEQLAEAWKDSLNAARILKEGKPVGRIAYYQPKVTIEHSCITAITGRGFLHERPEEMPVLHNAAGKTVPKFPWAGSWQTAFANGKIQSYEFSPRGTAYVSSHNWKSEGKIERKGNSFVITYKDDRVERWTPVRERIIVEHWHPAADYPAKQPIRGIAERKDS